MFVAAWLFIAVGLCLAILGVRGLWRMRRFGERSVEVWGRFQGDETYWGNHTIYHRPMVEFECPFTGRAGIVKGIGSTRGTYLPAGTPLRVRVDTQAPHEAILWRWAVVWLEPIAFLVFGLGTLALGAAAALKWVAR